MIKKYSKNERESTALIKDDETLIIKKSVDMAGSVILNRYLLKEIQCSGTVEQVKLAIVERLNAAEKAGYRYVDRVPANQTESIMIFERV